ncbi:MAG TPA: sugar ABC transporter permease, partial [Thermomicrobiales bacterium]|nr:sugar ABC transporter permease [Thermomicrobiales bacterium]
MKRWWRRVRRGDGLAALMFASPWIIGFCWFQLYPIGASLYYSFTSYNLLREPVYVGLDNYRNLFGHDELFRKALRNTGIFTLISVPLDLAVALIIALLLNRNIPGRGVFRAAFFFPAVIPSVATGILWIMVLNTQGGLVNVMLQRLGFSALPWLTSPDWAMPALILLSLWNIGPAIVIFLAGLQDVPRVLYEAAQLDGAGPWSLVRNVTIPMLSPVIVFNLLIGLISALQVFALPFILFANKQGAQSLGGPLNAALVYSVRLYSVAFNEFRMGYASAMAWVLSVIIFTLSLLALRLSRRF